jgi:cardiolipin synthase
MGFAFGHGIADEWLGNAEDEHHWRDTGVRLKGAVVRPLQSVFLQDWIEASGDIPVDDSCFPSNTHCGNAIAHVVSSTGDAKSSVALLYKLAIATARREIIIQNPYFTPNPQVPKLMQKMAARGVAVHLMVPGRHTDSPFVRRAGFHLYLPLLRAGVHLYEYQPTLLHQKIVIIDGKWSHVGSTNFDERSLALNAEIGVGILDETVATELRAAFEQDLSSCIELSLEQWERRPKYQQALDWCVYQLHGQI